MRTVKLRCEAPTGSMSTLRCEVSKMGGSNRWSVKTRTSRRVLLRAKGVYLWLKDRGNKRRVSFYIASCFYTQSNTHEPCCHFLTIIPTACANPHMFRLFPTHTPPLCRKPWPHTTLLKSPELTKPSLSVSVSSKWRKTLIAEGT